MVDAAAMSAVLTTAACGTGKQVVVTLTTTPGQPLTSQVTVPNGAGSSTAAVTTTSATATTSSVRVIASPKFGTVDVAPTAPVTVTTFNAKISELTVTDQDGAQVKGEIDSGGATWTLGQRLKYGSTYTFAGTATDASGTATPITGTLATVSPTVIRRSLVRNRAMKVAIPA